MAAASKFKYSSFVFPEGIAKYAWLDKPDPYQEEKGKTQYGIRLLLDDTTENRDFLAKVEATALAEAKKAKVKIKNKFHVPWVFPEHVDPEDYEAELDDDGNEIRKAKLDADHRDRIYIKATSAYPPALIGKKRDSSGAFIGLAEGTRIMSGDIVKPKIFVNPYEGLGSGFSLRLSVVQLIKKNTSFGGVRDSGFDVEDDEDDEIPF